MNWNPLHPDAGTIGAYLSDELDHGRRARVAAHVRDCVRCQDTLRFLTRVESLVHLQAERAPAGILERALASRGAGSRTLLPAGDVMPAGSRTPIGRRVAVVAAAAILATAYLLIGRPNDVAAVSADSDLRIRPAAPTAGSTIQLSYAPAGQLFANTEHVVVRARLREGGDGMYTFGVPATRLRAVAVLTRGADGRFAGSFTLPAATAFASLAVEDSSASSVDDNAGRLWDVLVHDPSGRPTYDALDQRINDMMGRSWDEAYSTAKQLAATYPDRIDALATRAFFERAVLGTRVADSLEKAGAKAAARLLAEARSRMTLSAAEISTIFYKASTGLGAKGATRADSAEFTYWLNRTVREHPRHAQLAQYYAFNFTPEVWKRPEQMLDSLERLYARFAPVRGPGGNLVRSGMQAAERSKRDDLYLRWYARNAGIENRGDSAYWVAMAMTRRPSLAREGMDALRHLLTQPPEAAIAARGLREDRREHAARADDARRNVLAALGRALIADGRTREGLDTLGAALGGRWDPVLFRSLRDGYVTARDSAGVQVMQLRLSVDPRTPPDSAAALTDWGRTRLGAARWDSLAATARREMHASVLARATIRPLRGSPSLVTADGRSVSLREVTRGRPAAVIFWSRHCGYAIDALPEIRRTAEHLTREGKAILFVMEEAPSPEVSRYLADLNWTLPVYYDLRNSTRNAFNTFGTPAYFVIDGAGRIRFDDVDEKAELIAQVDAVGSEGR